MYFTIQKNIVVFDINSYQLTDHQKIILVQVGGNKAIISNG